MLRALLAAGLAAFLAASAAEVHVHVADGARPDAPCAVCQLRGAEPVTGDAPEVAAAPALAVEVALPPGLPPVTGAPLGAVPGQSPPAAA